MSFRLFILYSAVAFFLLFYPGHHPYLMIFFHERAEFFSTQTVKKLKIPEAVKIDAPLPPISAQGLYIVDLETFTPIAKKNANELFYPASTTKVLTAITTRQLYKDNQILKIKSPKQIGQIMGLKEGEEISVENLLYGIIVQSGNDAAYALSESYPQDKFMQKMNQIARQLGMSKSYFSNPAGLDEPNQKTTPFELALASRELLKDDVLRKMVSIKQITVSDKNFTTFHELYNVNALLGDIPGLAGLKTGYTELAQENLISLYNFQQREYLIVLLKSEDRFEDTRTLIAWLRENVKIESPPVEHIVY